MKFTLSSRLVVILLVLSNIAMAQTSYFTEFVVPGIQDQKEQEKLTKLFNEMGYYDLRVSHFSDKVLIFSEKPTVMSEINESLKKVNYYMFLYNSGIQGVDRHNSFNVKEWNESLGTTYSSKIFTCVFEEAFTSEKRQLLENSLKSAREINDFEFSIENNKMVIRTNSNMSRDTIKKLMYSYKFPNKVIELIEIKSK